jgi:hypothetical protein
MTQQADLLSAALADRYRIERELATLRGYILSDIFTA